VDGETGVFFTEQTADGLREAVLKCERIPWRKERLRAHAERFGPDVFAARILDVVRHAVSSNAGVLASREPVEGEHDGWKTPVH
jgi:hypothetical protein